MLGSIFDWFYRKRAVALVKHRLRQHGLDYMRKREERIRGWLAPAKCSDCGGEVYFVFLRKGLRAYCFACGHSDHAEDNLFETLLRLNGSSSSPP